MNKFSVQANDVDSFSNSELIQAVANLKSTKQLLTSKVQQLKKQQLKAAENAYFKILNLNEEQANKFFKSFDNVGLSFSERIDSSVKSLSLEIKKLEMTLEVNTSTEDELEKSLVDLTAREIELLALQRQGKEPITLSSDYLTLIEQNQQSLSSTSDLKYRVSSTLKEANAHDLRVDRHRDAVFPQKAAFDATFANIIEQKELAVAESLAQLRATLKEKATLTSQAMDAEAQRLSRSLSSQRAQDLRQTDQRCEVILKDFIARNEVTSQIVLDKYTDQLKRFATAKSNPTTTPKSPSRRHLAVTVTNSSAGRGIDSAADSSNNSESEEVKSEPVITTPPTATVSVQRTSWKREVDARFSALFAEDAECQRLEREVDALLLAQMTETQMDTTSAEGLDPSYLSSLMDKLAALYADINESTRIVTI